MTRIYDIANDHVEAMAALDPLSATSSGIAGHETEMTDFSPGGQAAHNARERQTLDALATARVEGEADRIARDVMRERLGVSQDSFAAGERYMSLRTLGSPMNRIRSVFDQMPRTNEQDWSNIAARLALIPVSLDRYRATLDEGLAGGRAASKRQTHECAKQAETWSGQVAGQASFFDGIGAHAASSSLPGALGSDIDRGVAAANEAYAAFARYLRETYMMQATEREGAGRERYAILSRQWNGVDLDLDETYAWGWEELGRIDREIVATAAKIAPGGTVADARRLLESDPARSIEGADAYQAWLQQIHDEALDQLDGVHFDIDPRIKRMEVMIPPPGGALAPYYSGPSEDFSRPGRTWFPIGTRTRFPKWSEVTTAYHEGVPGHHLQVGATRCLDLSRFQRISTFVSGHGEGWALYAERLMADLGYLENPDYYMGMLSMQALRAVRVIVDVGMHLALPIPADAAFHPGEVWNHDLAVDFIVEKTGLSREFMTSEIVRYLGWPAQAISYKVGERRWLQARDDAKRREGGAFDLKRFHTRALGLGPMGLAQLETELARAG